MTRTEGRTGMTERAKSLITDYKLPHITAMFWVLKITATTLGETGGDMVAQTLKLGYVQASLLFLAIFAVALGTQLRVRKFHPALYWTVIAATSTAGTTMSDLINRGPGDGTAQNGLGYGGGAAVLISGLALVFVIWRLSGQTFDVEHITTFRGEMLYWAAILLSNTLGTSTGDYLSDSSGLSYWGSAMVIAGVMAVILGLHYFTRLSGVLLFWIAFVLTRPLGATVGDFLSKPVSKHGLALGTYGTSAAFVLVLALGIAFTHRHDRRRGRQRDPALEIEPVVSAEAS
jgi:uncharacterized membrane-anchored protein